MMRLSDRNFSLPIFALIIGAFLFVGAQRLGTVPLPDSGDESMILQVPYEILNRGLFAWPMYRYLGGNIENVWHSFRPVYYWLMTGFFEIFGWGLVQGRAFNLIAATLTLAIVFGIGRRMFDWRVALIAVVLLVSDNTFVERSRMVRNEYLAAMFALLAFYLFEQAEQRRHGWLYAASGLAAGAGVMTHTNIAYILGAILLLMLLRHGWRVLSSYSPYLFTGSAFLVMSYEMIYDIVDYGNVRLQYRGDRAHFARASSSGLWQNFLDEPARYRDWLAGSLLFPGVPRTLQHVFQALTLVALAYLVFVCVRWLRHKNLAGDPRVRVFLVTVFAVVFLAVATGRRRKYAIYMVYLSPWFALCAGIMLRDGADFIGRLRSKRWQAAALLYRTALASMVLVIVAYGALLTRQQFRFVREVTNPHLASFTEFSAVLRSVVPEGLCPASIERPVIWLAFPEADRCYASIERRMADNVDIDGKDYALIIPTRRNPAYIKDPDENYALLGTMENTPYGDLRVYYTGTDPRYRSLAPRRYQFFEKWRGHVSDEQLAAAREVWSADASELGRVAAGSENLIMTPSGLQITPPRKAAQIDLCSVELKPNTVYQLIAGASSVEAGWRLVIDDEEMGESASQMMSTDLQAVFRTFDGARVKITVAAVKKAAAPLLVMRLTIREVASVGLEN